jgi:hypothetical protein
MEKMKLKTKLKTKATKYDRDNDIRRRFIHRDPSMQKKVRGTSPEEAAGWIELAWRRGQHTGIHDAYRAIRKDYPEAAKALLENFGMRPNGVLG